MTLSPARDLFADARSFPSLFDATAETDATEPAPVVAPAAPVPALTVAVPADRIDVPVAGPTGDPSVTAVTFADLGLPPRMVATLARENITTPFPIQTATIPDAIAGRDVLGRGRTGSGKTLAFGVPIIIRLADAGKAAPGRPAALILVPTRELAMQVNDALTPLTRSMGLFSRTAVGGTAYDKQIRDLRRGVDILVATPGRLADLIDRGECSLADIEITVLDEADQMADMGFLPDVTALLEKTPERSQRLLFSATLDGDVDSLVKRFLHDPVTHSVDPSSNSVTTMAHHLLLIPPAQKADIIAAIGAREGRTIMFVRTQMAVDRLAGELAAVGVRAGALHGGKTQRVRTRTLAEFREGRVSVLVATDVAARGIHVDDVSLVVHIDPPKDSKDYLHRAGRTARAGESGTVVTLVMPRQRRSTYSMIERAGVTPERTEVRLDGPELADVTGARTPSGIPVRMDEPEIRGRGDRGDRPQRSFRDDRPRTGGYRGDQASRGFRTDRPHTEGAGYVHRTERPSYAERPQHTEGTGAGFTHRTDRPAHAEGAGFAHRGDRPQRTLRDDRGYSRPREDRPAVSRGRFERRTSA